METKTLDFACELKATGEAGSFEGYGSVFNLKDAGKDIVVPGAFRESLEAHKAAGRMPAMLWQHRQSEPIGVYTSMAEDSVGLKVRGQLALKTARGAEAYELMKMGALSGMSIGYRVTEGNWDQASGARLLKKLDLVELSLVTFPMLDVARVSGVKSDEEQAELDELARYLRKTTGFSEIEATALINKIRALHMH